jgi:ankyrin repeat protein
MKLWEAARDGDIDKLNQLLAAGAKTDEKNEYGHTPLMFAAENGRKEALEALLAAGAKVDDKDKHGYTALMLASKNGHNEAKKALIAAGAKVDEQNNISQKAPSVTTTEEIIIELPGEAVAKDEKYKGGLTVLMWAAHSGHVKAIETALAFSKVNEKSANGWTALMWATQNGHKEAVEALLTAGAKVDIKNNDGKTALDIAIANKQAEIKGLLENAINKADEKYKKSLATSMLPAHNSHKEDTEVLVSAATSAVGSYFNKPLVSRSISEGQIIESSSSKLGAGIETEPNLNAEKSSRPFSYEQPCFSTNLALAATVGKMCHNLGFWSLNYWNLCFDTEASQEEISQLKSKTALVLPGVNKQLKGLEANILKLYQYSRDVLNALYERKSEMSLRIEEVVLTQADYEALQVNHQELCALKNKTDDLLQKVEKLMEAALRGYDGLKQVQVIRYQQDLKHLNQDLAELAIKYQEQKDSREVQQIMLLSSNREIATSIYEMGALRHYRSALMHLPVELGLTGSKALGSTDRKELNC